MLCDHVVSFLFQITFIGEGAIDYGGPKREFFRIFSQEVGENYFKGQRGQPKFFRGDMLAVQVHTNYVSESRLNLFTLRGMNFTFWEYLLYFLLRTEIVEPLFWLNQYLIIYLLTHIAW